MAASEYCAIKLWILGSSAWNVNLHARVCAEAAGVVEASALRHSSFGLWCST